MFENNVSMDKWAQTPGTIEAAVMALSPAEKATVLQVLRKLKADVYTHAGSAGIKPTEWDGQTLENLLEAFEYASKAEQ